MFIAQLACKICSTCRVPRFCRTRCLSDGESSQRWETCFVDGDWWRLSGGRETRSNPFTRIAPHQTLPTFALTRRRVAPLALTLTLSLLSGVHGRSHKIRVNVREQNNRSREENAKWGNARRKKRVNRRRIGREWAQRGITVAASGTRQTTSNGNW